MMPAQHPGGYNIAQQVVSPSSTNDNISDPSCAELKDAIDLLPLGFYTVADATIH
jgi:hypothetical protein